MTYYTSLEQMMATTFATLSPPEQLTVAECAKQYVYIRQPGSYVGYWSEKLTPYLVEPQEILESLDYTGMIFVGPARTGKALALDTPIATPSGWSTMGDLQVGDFVFGDDGKPCRIIGTSAVMLDRKCYAVKFDDGAEIVADAEHLWQIYDTQLKQDRILCTEDMISTLRANTSSFKTYRYKVSVSAPLVTERAELPVDPYFLGLWLGDGFWDRSAIVMNRQESALICDRIEQVTGYKTRRTFVRGVNADRATVIRAGSKTLAQDLRELGLLKGYGVKHIPPMYLRASAAQRRELVRGIMDSDGHMSVKSNWANIRTVSKPIADGLFELLCSLGYKPRLAKYKNKTSRCGFAYMVSLAVDNPAEIFGLETKAQKGSGGVKRRTTCDTRNIVDIHPVNSVPVKCIAVDNDSHLYLAGKQMVPTHNTQMALNWVAHIAKTDPSNCILLHMTQATGRNWSKSELDKMFRDSPKIRKLLRPGRANDNTFDKEFLSGMRVEITWPTANNLSGKTSRRNWAMDYDRMPDNIDGEGNAYDLLAKRAESFKRFGMTAAESSPNPDKEITDPKWTPATPHQAPPIKGIFELYNRGDRRRWYWRCPQCREAFEPSFKLLKWPQSLDFMESAEQAYMACPHDGFPIEPAFKEELNMAGRWVKDGMIWMPSGDIIQRPGHRVMRSDIASFWMKGPAAAFQGWDKLVLNHLRAEDAYEKTGDEMPLRKTITTDQGEYYISKARLSDRLPEQLKSRAEDWGGSQEAPVVPYGVRFLIATIDVQKRSFVVQIHGIGLGGDIYIVDMFKIRLSDRLDDQGRNLPLSPDAYGEDWDVIVDQVMKRTYPLADESGRQMMIKFTVCDSGGSEGVTFNAYNFVRRLRANPATAEIARRFLLIKGEPSKSAPRIRLGFPDAQKKDRHSGSRGDVPVLFLNSNQLKDQAAAMLGREDAADGQVVRTAGMVHFPKWAPDWLYSQLTNEVRTDKGWFSVHTGGNAKRNEAFDLLYYCIGICLHVPINIEHLDWMKPPGWAEDWDKNDLVFGNEQGVPFMEIRKPRRSLSDLASDLA